MRYSNVSREFDISDYEISFDLFSQCRKAMVFFLSINTCTDQNSELFEELSFANIF